MIGIVNDRPLAVEALRRVIALKPEHQVIWVAGHGGEAVTLCAKTPPHLVLMDLIMPEMDRVEATRRIMASTPCPILIVTVSVGANSRRAFEAFASSCSNTRSRRMWRTTASSRAAGATCTFARRGRSKSCMGTALTR